MWKRNNVQKMIAIALGVMMLTGCAGGEQPTQSVQTDPAAASENTEKAGSSGQDSEKEQFSIGIREHRRPIRNLHRNVLILLKKNILI